MFVRPCWIYSNKQKLGTCWHSFKNIIWPASVLTFRELISQKRVWQWKVLPWSPAFEEKPIPRPLGSAYNFTCFFVGRRAQTAQQKQQLFFCNARVSKTYPVASLETWGPLRWAIRLPIGRPLNHKFIEYLALLLRLESILKNLSQRLNWF